MTRLQREVLAKVVRAHKRGEKYRAARSGERVTLASLYRYGLLSRVAWRGNEGEADAAYEYAPSEVMLDEIDIVRKTLRAAGWSRHDRATGANESAELWSKVNGETGYVDTLTRQQALKRVLDEKKAGA